MAKKGRPTGQPNPAIRLSNLRPRLAALFAEQADQLTLAAELDRLTEGLKPASFLPMLVGAFAGVPESQGTLLKETVVAWLRERGLLTALRDLEAMQTFDRPDRDVARWWIEAGGIVLAPEPAFTLADLLIDTYEVSDPGQASVTLFWYEDARRRRVRFGSFLIDFQPPWEGALKDLAYGTFRDSDQAHARYFATWNESPPPALLHQCGHRHPAGVDGTAPEPGPGDQAPRRLYRGDGRGYALPLRVETGCDELRDQGTREGRAALDDALALLGGGEAIGHTCLLMLAHQLRLPQNLIDGLDQPRAAAVECWLQACRPHRLSHGGEPPGRRRHMAAGDLQPAPTPTAPRRRWHGDAPALHPDAP